MSHQEEERSFHSTEEERSNKIWRRKCRFLASPDRSFKRGTKTI
jgi:hypothetical protein